MKSIKITVSPTGQTRVETKGFTGGECREAQRTSHCSSGGANITMIG